jgi:hypothetical protein
MKVNICESCLAEGKITFAKWSCKINRGIESVKIAICKNHKEQKYTYENALSLALKAEQEYNKIITA